MAGPLPPVVDARLRHGPHFNAKSHERRRPSGRPRVVPSIVIGTSRPGLERKSRNCRRETRWSGLAEVVPLTDRTVLADGDAGCWACALRTCARARGGCSWPNGKGSHQRLIPISGRFFRSVAAYMERERPAEANTDRLFVVLKGSRRGQPLSEDGLDEIFRGAQSGAGLAHIGCHGLRHTCLTRLREAGKVPRRRRCRAPGPGRGRRGRPAAPSGPGAAQLHRRAGR